jgi:hypothetical protein
MGECGGNAGACRVAEVARELGDVKQGIFESCPGGTTASGATACIPNVLAYVSHSVQDYKAKQATSAAKDSGTRQPPSAEDGPSRPNVPGQG